MLRFHPTTAVCFTLNRSWGLTHFHQLMCSELLSVFNAQLLFWLCSRETCSLFCPLDASPEGASVCRNTRPAACSPALPNPHPLASSAQMLWANAEGTEDRRALCGAVIAKKSQSLQVPRATNQQEDVLLSLMQRRINTGLWTHGQGRWHLRPNHI